MTEILERQTFATGEVIFTEGDVGRRCAYVLESGRVEISKRTADGGTLVLGYITPGAIFGEMALVDNKPRMAAARAVEPSIAILVTERVFEQKLRKADPFIRGLLNMFVRNIREMADKMTNTSLN